MNASPKSQEYLQNHVRRRVGLLLMDSSTDYTIAMPACAIASTAENVACVFSKRFNILLACSIRDVYTLDTHQCRFRLLFAEGISKEAKRFFP